MHTDNDGDANNYVRSICDDTTEIEQQRLQRPDSVSFRR